MYVTETKNRRVLVVDDHRTFTELVSMALARHPGLECAAVAHSVAEALAVLRTEAVDVVLTDLRMGRESGVVLTEQVRAARPDVPVVVLTAYPTAEVIRACAAAGASAVLPKDGAYKELVEAVCAARVGGFRLPQALTRLLAEDQPTSPAVVLTRREGDVLRALARGLDVRAISHELGLSLHTCRGYVKDLLRKLGAHTQLEAVVAASRLGLLPGDHAR